MLASIGSVGDAYDNALAESFVDSFKTELIADRVWRTRIQIELAIVEYVAWFNNERLHQALGDRPPAEVEALYAARTVLTPSLNQGREEPTKPGLRETQPGSALSCRRAGHREMSAARPRPQQRTTTRHHPPR